MTRCSSSLCHGYGLPRYFCDISSMYAFCGSSTRSAVPRTSRYEYGSSWGYTSTVTRGSRSRFPVLRLPRMVEKRMSSPSRPIHTTERWGRPSGSRVATVANSGRSSNFLASSGSVVMGARYVTRPVDAHRPSHLRGGQQQCRRYACEALATAGDAEAVRGRRRDADRRADGSGQHGLRLRPARSEPGSVTDDLHGDVADDEAGPAHQPHGLGEQLEAGRPRPPRVGRAELRPEVTQPRGRQQRVTAGVGGDVRVRMALEPRF